MVFTFMQMTMLQCLCTQKNTIYACMHAAEEVKNVKLIKKRVKNVTTKRKEKK